MNTEHVAITQRISQRLREERGRQNLSLSGLSKRTHDALSKSRISNYEQGIRRPGVEEVLALGEALDVSPSYLLGLDDSDQLTQQEHEIIGLYRSVDDRCRFAVRSLLEERMGCTESADRGA